MNPKRKRKNNSIHNYPPPDLTNLDRLYHKNLKIKHMLNMLISTQPDIPSKNANPTARAFDYIMDEVISKTIQSENKQKFSNTLHKLYKNKWPDEVFNNYNELVSQIDEYFLEHGNSHYIRSIRDALPNTVGDMPLDAEVLEDWLVYFKNQEQNILLNAHAPKIKPLSFTNSMTEYTRILNDSKTNRILASAHGDIHVENFRLFKVPDNVIIVHMTPFGCTSNAILNKDTKHIFESPEILYDFLRNPSKIKGVKPALRHATIVPPGQIALDVNLYIEDGFNVTMMFKINNLRGPKWNISEGWSEPPRKHPLGKSYKTVKAMCHAVPPDQNAVILVDSCRVINSRTIPGNSKETRWKRSTLQKTQKASVTPDQHCPRILPHNLACGSDNNEMSARNKKKVERLKQQRKYEIKISNEIKGKNTK